MCLAKAYMGNGEGEKPVMEDVAYLKIEGERLLLRTLFGEQREVEALIREVDFQNSSIILEDISGRTGK